MDSEGGRLKGARFSVGSGSPYAYGVLDDGSVHSPLRALIFNIVPIILMHI